MKRIMIELLAIFLLFATTPFALAQHGGHGGTSSSSSGFGHAGHDSPMADLQRTLMLQATDDQRQAFAKCMEATERVHKVADEMVGPGSRWRYDADVFPGQKEQLQTALADMTTAHQQFKQTLSQAQEKELNKYFNKLERLQSDVSSRLLGLDRELTTGKPDPRRVYSDAHKIKEAVDKWRSEHRKIAKEMSIAG
jgi:hypothetical protein